MTYGVKKLRKIQLGAEGTAGTAVPATTIWRGTGTIQDETEVIDRNEDVGYLSGIDSGYIPTVGAMLEMPETEATFEQLPYIFLAGIDGSVTPGTDGSGKVWTFAAATTAQKTPLTYTVEGGDNTQEEEFAYGFVEEFTLKGTPKQPLTLTAKWRGRQVAPSTYTAGQAIPAVEEILFQRSQLYIDAVGGTLGGTIKSNTLLGFELNWKTGFIPVWAGDGQLYFSFVKQIEPEISMSVTFEHDGTATAEKAYHLARTSRKMRISTSGTALASVGSTYTNKVIQVNLAGHWKSFSKIDEQDGNDIVTGTFIAKYNATATLFASITHVNELATMP